MLLFWTSIHQRIRETKYFMVSTKIVSRKTVYTINNKQIIINNWPSIEQQISVCYNAFWRIKKKKMAVENKNK